MSSQTAASVLTTSKSSSTLKPLLLRILQQNPTTTTTTTTRSFSTTNNTAAATSLASADAIREVKKSRAPPSTLSIQTTVRRGPIPLRTPSTPSSSTSAAAAIREVGVTRRVFLLDPHFTTDELHGLAYRLDLLGRNTSINSVLIATTDDDDVEHNALPTSVVDTMRKPEEMVNWMLKTTSSSSSQDDVHWHVSGGYDARAAYESNLTKDPVQVMRLLEGIKRLALATRGGSSVVANEALENETPKHDDIQTPPSTSRVPIITIPHGLINDGGYALCMSSYVLATRESSVRFLNPWKGLSFDPVGLSFVLPRLGWEYRQISAEYPVGLLLALTGYEADAFDMVETGLATHYIDSVSKVGYLEKALGSAVLPWNQQGLHKKRKTLYGQNKDTTTDSGPGFRGGGRRKRINDPNDKYRNVSVANLIHSVSEYDAARQEIMSTNVDAIMKQTEDPSLTLGHDRFAMNAPRESRAVTIAATFADFFTREKSVEGTLDQLKQVASTHAEKSDVEERECGEIAADLVSRMESACPLSLKVVHKLMMMGSKSSETLESCMEREMNVQKNMLMGEDFERWVKSGAVEGEFRGWKHESLKDVTNDEVEEILSSK